MSEETATVNSIDSHTIWSSDRNYEFALIAFVLGITNTVQFMDLPKYQGIQFLFAYIAFLLVLGIPLVIVELSLGQYSGKGMMKFWDISPVFYGIAYMSFVFNILYLVEDIILSARLLRYTLNQFFWNSGDWKSCKNSWNDEFCYTLQENLSMRIDCYNLHDELECDKATWRSSYSQYYYRRINTFGTEIIAGKQMAHVATVVFIIGLVAHKGMRFMEKFISISLVVAAINFAILLYKALIQKGSGLGLSYFIYFDVELFKDSEFWCTIFKLTVWSTGIGSGALQFLGSQNRFRGHSYMNGMMIILVLITVTVVELILYLSLCGCFSYTFNLPVRSIFFDDEPTMYSKIPKMLESFEENIKFWNFLYYSHLLLIIMAKTVILSYIMQQAILELSSRIQSHPKRTSFITFCVIFGFCCLLETKFGMGPWTLIDNMIVKGPVVSICAVIQITVIIYVYGLTTVVDDMHFMLGFRMSIHWQIILFLSPVILFILCVRQVIHFCDRLDMIEGLNEEAKPFLRLALFMPIVITAGYAIWYVRKLIWNCKWENVLIPDDSWFLTDQILKKSREMFSSSNMTEEYLYRQSKRREIMANDAVLYID